SYYSAIVATHLTPSTAHISLSYIFFLQHSLHHQYLHSFPTRRSSDLKIFTCMSIFNRTNSSRKRSSANFKDRAAWKICEFCSYAQKRRGTCWLNNSRLWEQLWTKVWLIARFQRRATLRVRAGIYWRKARI